MLAALRPRSLRPPRRKALHPASGLRLSLLTALLVGTLGCGSLLQAAPATAPPHSVEDRNAPTEDSQRAGLAEGLDPDFAALPVVLGSRTTVPLWLPSSAPRAPQFGLLCLHYGLATFGGPNLSSETTTDGYVVQMRCTHHPLPPDDPSLYVPGTFVQPGYLGALLGGPAVVDEPQPLEGGDWHSFLLADGTLAQRSAPTDQNAVDTIQWSDRNWEFRVLTDVAGEGGAPARAEELAALARANLPVPDATRGVVEFREYTRPFTTVYWQAEDGTPYELAWYGQIAPAITLAQSMRPVRSE